MPISQQGHKTMVYIWFLCFFSFFRKKTTLFIEIKWLYTSVIRLHFVFNSEIIEEQMAWGGEVVTSLTQIFRNPNWSWCTNTTFFQDIRIKVINFRGWSWNSLTRVTFSTNWWEPTFVLKKKLWANCFKRWKNMGA